MEQHTKKGDLYGPAGANQRWTSRQDAGLGYLTGPHGEKSQNKKKYTWLQRN